MSNGCSILIRCDGSPNIGFGNVMRCLAVADELRTAHGCRVVFAIRHGRLGCEIVRKRGYQVLSLSDQRQPLGYTQWLAKAIDDLKARALILDVRDGLPRATVAALRKQGCLIVTLDDPSNRRLAADIAFYPPLTQMRNLDWSGFAGELYVGWEWVVLGREFANEVRLRSGGVTGRSRPKILVTMGRSDPTGLTLKAVMALDRIAASFETTVVLGPGFSHQGALANLLAKTRRHFRVIRNTEQMPALMADTDLALASFGITAYELAAMGVPAIHLAPTADYLQSASIFVEEGLAVCLRAFPTVEEAALAQTIAALLEDLPGRLDMGSLAKKQIDGLGARRISSVVSDRIMRLVPQN